VEQPTAGRLEDVGSPAQLDGDSTTETKGDHMAGLRVCRPGSAWAECP
jgi:hypothetical protein